MTFHSMNEAAVNDPPKLDRMVKTGRSKNFAIRTEGYAYDTTMMTFHTTNKASVQPVPELYRFIRTGRSKNSAVRTVS